MEYVNLGRAGLQVSRLCLGTMNFGSQTGEAESFAVMDKALEAGINFFDTANIYGGKAGRGATEQIIGRWLSQGGGRREKIVLATKVYNKTGEGPNDRGLSAYHIRRACQESLRRLQTDHIDLYQMHHVDRQAPWEEIWQATEQLTREGKITYVGSSNFAAWHIVAANEAAARRNLLGLVSEQSKYSLACRWVELEVLPACRAYGLGVIPWSPLAGGLLGGMSGEVREGRRASKHVQEEVVKLRPQLEEYERLCRKTGESPADVALAWLLANPAVTAPIIGPRTVEQLAGCLRCLEIKLDEQTMKGLDAIWPGQGGAAPEAYAW